MCMLLNNLITAEYKAKPDTRGPETFKYSKDPLMTPPEAMGIGGADYSQYYSKTALGLTMLRDNILGPERFRLRLSRIY